MFILDDENTKLQLVTSTGADCDISIEFVDVVAGTSSEMKSQETATTTAATTEVLAAPANLTQRRVHKISVVNKDTIAQVVYLAKDVSSTLYRLTPAVTLQGGEMLMIGLDGELKVYDVGGRIRTYSLPDDGYDGWASSYAKVGAASEAAGYFYCFAHTAGNPGIWAIGTPGLNGRAPDGTATADFGCHPYKNAASGANYLADWKASASVLGMLSLVDFLWVNSGISGTTTTNQAITSAAFAARDLNGTVNGKGCGIALYFYTAAGTNGAAISGATVSYTNSAGTAGRTATLKAVTGFQIPATPALGTWVPFTLQAGDDGVQSIQGITLGTSLGVASCAHLVVYRVLSTCGPFVIYTPGAAFNFQQNPGVKLYNGTCAHVLQWATATTATNVVSQAAIVER